MIQTPNFRFRKISCSIQPYKKLKEKRSLAGEESCSSLKKLKVIKTKDAVKEEHGRVYQQEVSSATKKNSHILSEFKAQTRFLLDFLPRCSEPVFDSLARMKIVNNGLL